MHTQRLLLFAGVTLALLSFQAPQAPEGSPGTLQRPGWIALFNGRDMTGWRTYKNKPCSCWDVEDGALHCKGGPDGADLITTGTYGDFDLEIDWKLAPQANSGILYHVTEDYDYPFQSGPEYQLIDDEHYPEKLEDYQHTGANYAMNVPTSIPTKPIGEWNHTRILVRRGHVEHWLNGVKVVEYQLWTDDWKKRKAGGKWKDAPGYGMARTGYISLQDHGDQVWFKNIKIKPL
jgi:hypothetical protein